VTNNQEKLFEESFQLLKKFARRNWTNMKIYTSQLLQNLKWKELYAFCLTEIFYKLLMHGKNLFLI